MSALWAQLIKEVEGRQLQYCVLRDIPSELSAADEPVSSSSTTRRVEVDFLVAEEQLPELSQLLSDSGFIRLQRWGYAPHQFFVAYDESCDLWLKLDVVTRIAFGQPAHVFRSKLADDCLRNRVRSGNTFVPAPEEEFVTLLLHCLIDKRNVRPDRRTRLQQIARMPLDEGRLETLIAEYFPAGHNWASLRKRVLEDDWESLLLDRAQIVKHLGRSDPFRRRGRQIRDRILRKLSRIRTLVKPEVPTVALLAPDGAGKSTVAQGVVESFFFPSRLVYMGMYQKNHHGYGTMKIPVVGLVIRMSRQWLRYARARLYQAGGRLVLFDRYNYDAMLNAGKNEGVLRRVRRWMLAHSCPHADMVFMLDAPGESLYERKQEHSVEILEEQRLAYRALSQKLPQMVIVDATKDINEVRREVLSGIWRGCAKTRR
ncbi:MAG: hypothetical protein AB7O26_11835 [Planctomycetaceae bacterium]